MPDIKKLIKYKNEQDEIYNKLLEILNYNNNYSFTLDEIDNNSELQLSVLSLINDIKKYYPSSSCTAITNKECKRPYMSIIRYILKFYNRALYSNEICIPQGNKKYFKTIKYKII